MKRIILTIFVLLTGITVFAQSADMSNYTAEYNRSDATFIDRFEVLQIVQDANLTGIGEFYHECLKGLINKIPDIKTKEDWEATEASAIILCKGLAAEKYTAAAQEIWSLVQEYSTVKSENDGIAMQEALIALGQVGDNDYVPHVVQSLNDLITQETSDVETKRRIQRGAAGAINALEALHDIRGFRPVFFASIGWFDPAIKSIAYNTLPNIVEDPGEEISEIIRNPINNPNIKITAWEEMLRTRAPNSSKAKVAAVALAVGWNYPINNPNFLGILRDMRMSAIDHIRLLGVEDDSVYANLDRSYLNNYHNNFPDYDEIKKAIDCLSEIKTDEAVGLLFKYLRELNERRRGGPWGNKERRVMQMVIPGLGATKTQSAEVRALLTAIQRSDDYTGAEQGWATSALRVLDQ